ncbi:MAG: hypothetical protein J0L97_04475 [Alphaproteobacteria bacterium]|nr:hypothetical protein [Alphaproteobacteria bacterium]
MESILMEKGDFNPAYAPQATPLKEFTPLAMPRRTWAEDRQLHKVYRVFSASGEVAVVEADTATDAIQKSGLETPVKVVKGRFSMENILAPGTLKETSETVLTRVDLPH